MMAREHIENTSNVDAILLNLTKRPNVRSTLILSRKDGSIIKVSGAIAEDSAEQQRQKQSYDTADSSTKEDVQGKDVEQAQEEDVESNVEEDLLSPSRVLAESIYAFVASAASLAASLSRIESVNESLGGRTDSNKGGKGKDESSIAQTANQADDDVQLLRLRLKKQEVIIFPDPNYLCCVVQDLEKGTR